MTLCIFQITPSLLTYEWELKEWQIKTNVVPSLLLLMKISIAKYVKEPFLYELLPKSDQFFQQKQTKIRPKCA